MEPVIVLGFGTAGASAVAALRDAGCSGRIAVVTDGESEPVSPVLTSYYAGGRIARDQCFAWSGMNLAGMADVVRAHVRAVSLDSSAHEIELSDGTRMTYSKLLVATGAHPVAPGFPGTGAYRPHMLRTLRDAERLGCALAAESCREALVSGTSMVGLKALEACLDRGVHVTLLGRSEHILRNAAHPAVAERFERLLAERGVALRLGQTACDAQGLAHGCSVRFSDDGTGRFDEIILAQGVKPNLDFLGNPGDSRREADAVAETDRGLEVDEFMRTRLPDVFAAGDVARALDVSSGEKRVIGLWQNAVQQGRVAGWAMADELAGRAPARPFPGSVPCNIIHVRDILFASVGTLAQREGRRFEVRDDGGDGLRVLAYDGEGCDARLVGYNALAIAAGSGGTGVLDGEVGRRRREILNAYL